MRVLAALADHEVVYEKSEHDQEGSRWEAQVTRLPLLGVWASAAWASESSDRRTRNQREMRRLRGGMSSGVWVQDVRGGDLGEASQGLQQLAGRAGNGHTRHARLGLELGLG